MTKQEPLLEVKNLVVEIPTRREKLIALDKVSFEIYPGEVLGVVGESGAGKSMVGGSGSCGRRRDSFKRTPNR